MSYTDDQIRILELICADLPPNDFHNEQRVVQITEDELKSEGFSYYAGFNLLKDMYEYILNIHTETDANGKRNLVLLVSEFIQPYLSSLKYPINQEEMEEDYFYEMANHQNLIQDSNSKISITIDNNNGIYISDDKKKQYPLSSTSQRMKIIKYLLSHEKGSISDLQKQTEQIHQVISQEIRRMNISFKEKLEVKDNLIIRMKTGGYYLNRESFDIKDNT